MKTDIISGFAGVGKTTFVNQMKRKGIEVLDSDSSQFSSGGFPLNCINHIKENLGDVSIILISSHKEVREILKSHGIDYTLVYPSIDLKEEYLERYSGRGSSPAFINLLSNNWIDWVNDCKSQDGCRQIVLEKGEYLSDVIPLFN